MGVDREKLRREIGVRKSSDLDTTVDFRMCFRPPDWLLASIHPAVVMTESLESVRETVDALAADGHPVLAAEVRGISMEGASLANSIEGAIIAARTLAHFTGGRTMDMHATGAAVPIAAAAYALERDFFDGFYATAPSTEKIRGRDWKTLTGK